MHIAKRVLGIISCVDDNKDEIRVIEGMTSNTSVLNVKSTNTSFEADSINTIQTEIIIDLKKAVELKNVLEKWIDSQINHLDNK